MFSLKSLSQTIKTSFVLNKSSLKKSIPLFYAQQNLIQFPKFQFLNYAPKNSFSSSNDNEQDIYDYDLEEIISGIGKENRQEYEEPVIPQSEMDRIKGLRASVSQNIQLGHFAQAHQDAFEYIQMIKKYYGIDHPALFSALNNLALIYKIIGEREKAKLLYTKILEGYLKIFGHKHISSVTVMQNLANLLKEMKEHDQAVKIYEDVLDLRRELQPEKVIEQAVCLSSMAGTYRELGKFDRSEQVLLEALEIFHRELGEEHLNTAACLNNLALTYKKMKQYSKAEENYLKSLKIREKLLDEIHPDLIAIKHNLGELYLAMDLKDKAHEYLLESMQLIKKSEEMRTQSM